MLVLLDDLVETMHAIQLLQGSGGTLLFTTRAHLEGSRDMLRKAGLKPVLLEPPADGGAG